MPTYRDIEKATGASRTLIRAIAKELDPKCQQRKLEGKLWIVSDHLAALIAREATKRVRKSDSETSLKQPSALEILERSHRRELESLQTSCDAQLKAAEQVIGGLRESLAERDKTIDALRAEVATLKADSHEMRETLAGIAGARWYTRAFNLRRLLPKPKN